MNIPQEEIEKKAEEIALQEGREAHEVTRYDLVRAREEIHREVTGEADFGAGGTSPLVEDNDESTASSEDPVRQEDVERSPKIGPKLER
jgi:hypothetical protein